MTYQKIEEKIVNEEKITDKKGLRKFTLKWALMIIGIGLTLAMPAYSLVNSTFTIIVLLLCGFLFSQLLSYIVESPDRFKACNLFSNFWWVTIFTIIGMFLVLKYFNFM